MSEMPEWLERQPGNVVEVEWRVEQKGMNEDKETDDMAAVEMGVRKMLGGVTGEEKFEFATARMVDEGELVEAEVARGLMRWK